MNSWLRVTLIDRHLLGSLARPSLACFGITLVMMLLERADRTIRLSLEALLRPLLARDITTITRRDMSSLVDDMSDRAPIHANRALAYAKAMFNWAVGRGDLEASPAAALAKPSRENTRDRTPPLEELREIWRAAEALGYPFGPIVKLLILTAGRREEVGAIQVAELAIGETVAVPCWILPAARSKNRRAIRTPLCPLAHACDVLHVDPAVADRCLNHAGSATASTVARIYGRNELFEQRRDALARWAVLLTNGTWEPPCTEDSVLTSEQARTLQSADPAITSIDRELAQTNPNLL